MASKKISNAKTRRNAPTQAEHRRSIDVGPLFSQVSSVTSWYRGDHFASEEEARGAFKLAYQQGLDGMGSTIADWMGLTSDEYNAWMVSNALPKRKKR